MPTPEVNIGRGQVVQALVVSLVVVVIDEPLNLLFQIARQEVRENIDCKISEEDATALNDIGKSKIGKLIEELRKLEA